MRSPGSMGRLVPTPLATVLIAGADGPCSSQVWRVLMGPRRKARRRQLLRIPLPENEKKLKECLVLYQIIYLYFIDVKSIDELSTRDGSHYGFVDEPSTN